MTATRRFKAFCPRAFVANLTVAPAPLRSRLCCEDLFQDAGNLEDRTILHAGGGGAILAEGFRQEQVLHRPMDPAEAGENHADPVFANPICVVAFLRKRP